MGKSISVYFLTDYCNYSRSLITFAANNANSEKSLRGNPSLLVTHTTHCTVKATQNKSVL